MLDKIIGKQINLRYLKKFDALSVQKNAKDFEIARYTTIPHPYTLKNAEDFIKLTHLKINKKKAFEYGIELKETRGIIGMIGLMNIDYNNKNAEVGYWLGKNYWGKGIMKDAIKLILNFGFKELKLVRIYARVMHPNIASAKLLEKSGFKCEGTMRKSTFRNDKWMDNINYSILSNEFMS